MVMVIMEIIMGSVVWRVGRVKGQIKYDWVIIWIRGCIFLVMFIANFMVDH